MTNFKITSILCKLKCLYLLSYKKRPIKSCDLFKDNTVMIIISTRISKFYIDEAVSSKEMDVLCYVLYQYIPVSFIPRKACYF